MQDPAQDVPPYPQPDSQGIEFQQEQANLDVNNNLIINYIPNNLAELDLKNLFAPFGEIVHCKLVLDKITGMVAVCVAPVWCFSGVDMSPLSRSWQAHRPAMVSSSSRATKGR